MNHRYKLSYDIKTHPKGLSAAEAKKQNKETPSTGFCDAVLLCSLIYPEDGSFSCYFLGVDGRKEGVGPLLEDIEWFKVWTLLASRLADSTTLSPEKKDQCRRAFEGVRQAILGNSLN